MQSLRRISILLQLSSEANIKVAATWLVSAGACRKEKIWVQESSTHCNAMLKIDSNAATAISSRIAAVNQQFCLCLPPTDVIPLDLCGWNRSGLRLLRLRHSCHFAVTEGGNTGGSAFACMQI